MARQPFEAMEDLERAVHWNKQALALLTGVIFGVSGVMGFVGFISFVALAATSTWATYAIVYRVDREALGMEGQAELVKEGLMPAIATFILSWTFAFNLSGWPELAQE